AALAFNVFVLPRIGGKALWRAEETERGRSLGIVLYPAAVLGLLLLFWHRLEVVTGVWAILAFGDGMASICGMTLRGPRLAWNPRKTWAGTLGYWIFGSAGCFVLVWWTLHHQGESIDLGVLAVVSAITAAFAALIESQPIQLDDNVSVPLLAALMLHGLLMSAETWPAADAESWLRGIGLGALINLLLAVPAYLAKSVDLSGAIGGGLLGTLIWASLGPAGFAFLVAFFIIGTGATKLGYQRKAKAKLAQEAGGRRSARHAFANTGVPAIAAFFAATTPHAELYLVAFVAAFATATSDTLGSEIGQLYGRRTFLITTLRPVPRGTEGAVSLEGTLAGVLGSLVLGLIGWVVGFYGWIGVAVVVAAAFVGTTLESLIGATIERWGLLDNEAVNFLNTLIGALAAAGLMALVS
ncbi:MAG: DUF92 domain-containing protein, partial [Acidobacteriota bacterium]